jgi:hypothetical protein
MKKNKKVKKQLEFSKKIFYMVATFTVVVILYSMALMWKTNDSSALSYLIPSVFGLMSTCIGFYFWKARKENELKILNKYGTDIYNELKNEDIETELEG